MLIPNEPTDSDLSWDGASLDWRESGGSPVLPDWFRQRAYFDDSGFSDIERMGDDSGSEAVPASRSEEPDPLWSLDEGRLAEEEEMLLEEELQDFPESVGVQDQSFVVSAEEPEKGSPREQRDVLLEAIGARPANFLAGRRRIPRERCVLRLPHGRFREGVVVRSGHKVCLWIGGVRCTVRGVEEDEELVAFAEESPRVNGLEPTFLFEHPRDRPGEAEDGNFADSRIIQPLGTKTRPKRVSQKVHPKAPMSADLPEDFHQGVYPGAEDPTKVRLTPERLANLNIGPDLLEKEREYLIEGLKARDSAFAFEDSERGCLREGICPPIRIYTVPHEAWQDSTLKVTELEEDEVSRLLKDKLQARVCERCRSPYVNRWFLLRKANGKLRWIQSLIRVNNVAIRNAGRIPDPEKTSERMSGLLRISTMDLFSGYDQLPIDPRDRDLTAMSTPIGHIRMCKMPQGYCNAVSEFQNVMYRLFEDMIPEELVVYLDDLMLRCTEKDESVRDGMRVGIKAHIDLIFRVLDRVQWSGLTISGEKSKFCYHEAKVLGYTVSLQGRKVPEDRYEVIRSWPAPRTKTGVKSFLGFVRYYRAWIPRLSQRSKRLNHLTCENVRFEWTDREQQEFDDLRDALTRGEILAKPDFRHLAERPFHLEVDASGIGIGACLKQEDPVTGQMRPVRWESKFLNERQRNYTQLKRELLAVHTFTRKLDGYLRAARFVLVIDPLPLKYLLESLALPDAVTQRWAYDIALRDFSLMRIPSGKNTVADSLSRQEAGGPSAEGGGDHDDELVRPEEVRASHVSDATAVEQGSKGEHEEDDPEWEVTPQWEQDVAALLATLQFDRAGYESGQLAAEVRAARAELDAGIETNKPQAPASPRNGTVTPSEDSVGFPDSDSSFFSNGTDREDWLVRTDWTAAGSETSPTDRADAANDESHKRTVRELRARPGGIDPCHAWEDHGRLPGSTETISAVPRDLGRYRRQPETSPSTRQTSTDSRRVAVAILHHASQTRIFRPRNVHDRASSAPVDGTTDVLLASTTAMSRSPPSTAGSEGSGSIPPGLDDTIPSFDMRDSNSEASDATVGAASVTSSVQTAPRARTPSATPPPAVRDVRTTPINLHRQVDGFLDDLDDILPDDVPTDEVVEEIQRTLGDTAGRLGPLERYRATVVAVRACIIRRWLPSEHYSSVRPERTPIHRFFYDEQARRSLGFHAPFWNSQSTDEKGNVIPKFYTIGTTWYRYGSELRREDQTEVQGHNSSLFAGNPTPAATLLFLSKPFWRFVGGLFNRYGWFHAYQAFWGITLGSWISIDSPRNSKTMEAWVNLLEATGTPNHRYLNIHVGNRVYDILRERTAPGWIHQHHNGDRVRVYLAKQPGQIRQGDRIFEEIVLCLVSGAPPIYDNGFNRAPSVNLELLEGSYYYIHEPKRSRWYREKGIRINTVSGRRYFRPTTRTLEELLVYLNSIIWKHDFNRVCIPNEEPQVHHRWPADTDDGLRQIRESEDKGLTHETVMLKKELWQTLPNFVGVHEFDNGRSLIPPQEFVRLVEDDTATAPPGSPPQRASRPLTRSCLRPTITPITYDPADHPDPGPDPEYPSLSTGTGYSNIASSSSAPPPPDTPTRRRPPQIRTDTSYRIPRVVRQPPRTDASGPTAHELVARTPEDLFLYVTSSRFIRLEQETVRRWLRSSDRVELWHSWRAVLGQRLNFYWRDAGVSEVTRREVQSLLHGLAESYPCEVGRNIADLLSRWPKDSLIRCLLGGITYDRDPCPRPARSDGNRHKGYADRAVSSAAFMLRQLGLLPAVADSATLPHPPVQVAILALALIAPAYQGAETLISVPHGQLPSRNLAGNPNERGFRTIGLVRYLRDIVSGWANLYRDLPHLPTFIGDAEPFDQLEAMRRLQPYTDPAAQYFCGIQPIREENGIEDGVWRFVRLLFSNYRKTQPRGQDVLDLFGSVLDEADTTMATYVYDRVHRRYGTERGLDGQAASQPLPLKQDVSAGVWNRLQQENATRQALLGGQEGRSRRVRTTVINLISDEEEAGDPDVKDEDEEEGAPGGR